MPFFGTWKRALLAFSRAKKWHFERPDLRTESKNLAKHPPKWLGRHLGHAFPFSGEYQANHVFRAVRSSFYTLKRPKNENSSYFLLAFWRPRSYEEEDSRTRHCQSLTSGGIFDTWSESQFFQTCGRSGKLWSTWRSFLGQHQAAGINLKVNLGLCIAYRWSETLCSPQEESLWSFPEGTPTLPPLLTKTNLTIQGWLTDGSSPFPIANLTCLTRR